jgi:predicted PhzF superfamily epimerase YddE/YHI9
MKVPYFIVNAFSKISFAGNPTGVCILKDWLSTDDLQKIASQTQMAETVFLFPSASNQWSIRWFSPLVEKDLSGHGTLAAAHILLEEDFADGNQPFNFSSSGGRLMVEKRAEGLLHLEMDILKARSCVASPLLVEGLGAYPDETFVGMDCLCVFSDESIVRELQPEPRLLRRIGSARGIIVTSKSDDSKIDYVTRFFSPRLGVDEDEVSGSIHALLVPYWFKKLGKVKMRASQLSPRGTSIACGLEENYVWVDGYADTFLRGEITL